MQTKTTCLQTTVQGIRKHAAQTKRKARLAVASIFQTRSGGNWTAQVNVGGKRRSKTFDSKREAQKWARQAEATVDAGKNLTSDRIRFQDVARVYVEAITSGTKQPSRSKLTTIRILCEHIGRRPIMSLDVSAYREFIAQRKASGAGPATIGQDLTYIGTILRHGGALLEIGVDAPLSALSGARLIASTTGDIGSSKERDRRPTDGELTTLRDFWAKRRRGIPMWTITCFAAATAMRLSEITNLKWSGFDPDARTILIRDRKHPKQKQGNDQTIPLLAGPCVIGGDVIDPAQIIQSMHVEAPEIFPFDAATVSTMFSRATRSCGIEDLRFHDLRHHACSNLFEAGYSIEQVALVSGHRDWNMLRRYTQIKPETLHRDPTNA